MAAFVTRANRCVSTSYLQRYGSNAIRRPYSTPPGGKIDVKELIENSPAWDMNELLPHSSDAVETITSKQLHHLHRLCALSPPKDASEESRLISDLSAQLHFVRQIQKVDTTGIEPLCSLRDETEVGIKEATIGLEQLKDALAKEEIRGKYNKKIRRRRGAEKPSAFEWDPLDQASRKVGKYFVVDGPSKGRVDE